ncbi:hypothetical protein [Aliidiomarina quisquiliarum]|uniref:hypothetical protein n=1 Tax=Aliidiomarina quisquiliarum TaxID=2938947 RepID=UPI00208E096D|nr:hypothetical protein [Aliidiomarina quisquiliarum]MCO4319977.1 hypothetical protein [Aliidiomarina quisquiliarum]
MSFIEIPFAPSKTIFSAGNTVYWQDVCELVGHEHSSGLFTVVTPPDPDDFDSFDEVMTDGIYVLSNGVSTVEAYHHELRQPIIDEPCNA